MRRQDSLEKTGVLGKIEGSRERGRPNMRWIDSEKAAVRMSLQGLSRAVANRTLHVTQSPGARASSTALNTYTLYKYFTVKIFK